MRKFLRLYSIIPSALIVSPAAHGINYPCATYSYNKLRKRRDLTFMKHLLCARPPSKCVLYVLIHVILQKAYKTGVTVPTPLHFMMSNVRL